MARRKRSKKSRVSAITGSGRNATACLTAPKVKVSKVKSKRRRGFGGTTPSGLKKILNQITPSTLMQ